MSDKKEHEKETKIEKDLEKQISALEKKVKTLELQLEQNHKELQKLKRFVDSRCVNANVRFVNGRNVS